MEKVSANDQGKPPPFGAVALARTFGPIAPRLELLRDLRNSLSCLEFLNEAESRGLIEEW